MLWVMLGVSALLCTLLFKFNRTEWTVTVALAIPFGLYTLPTYAKTVNGLIYGVMLAAVAFSIAYTALLMSNKIKNRSYKRQIIKNRLYKCFCTSQSFIAVGMLTVMLALGVNGLFGINIINPSIRSVKGSDDGQTIANNIETIKLLQEDEWRKLSTKRKIDVLQTVANIEAHYLGLPNELNVGAANLDEDIWGDYIDSKHVIRISLNHLENSSARDVLNTCCHEAYHGYQYRMIDAYNDVSPDFRRLRLYNRAEAYAEEFDNYAESDEDIIAYYSQACESDARDYADYAVDDYYEKIEKYLSA